MGPSVIAIGRSFVADGGVARRLGKPGVATGGIMAVGFLGLAGIALRLDDANTAPGWVWIGFIGWLGAFVLYPAWAIWLSRASGGERYAGSGRISPVRPGSTRRTVVTRSIDRSHEAIVPTPVRSAEATR